MIVQTLGTLAALDSGYTSSLSYSSIRMYNNRAYAYAELYRTQPNVRTCVDFLARNIAQLGLHTFRRVSDTDRVRLTDHPLAELLKRPLPEAMKVTRYRLIEGLVSDMGIYFNAYWLKMKQSDGRRALLRVPPDVMTLKGLLTPTAYVVNLGGKRFTYQPEAVVHFRGYNPENPITGLSPLETLRRVLAEEFSMGDYREHFWANSARMSGIIKRPASAPEWSAQARERFKAEYDALYSGGPNSGNTAILEEDMEWQETSFNAQESEYLGGRKLTREECARAYHIPLPMVGILDHATFANIKEQHKNLYQDCLGPWLTMIEEDIALQLLTDFEDSDGVYVEFNIQEKLQGSFEEQAQGFQSAVGRPWMVADEARARMNLPSMGGDAAELVTPLNVLVGGQASPRDSAPDGGDDAPPSSGDASAGESDEDGKAQGGLLPAVAIGQRKLRGVKEARVDPTLPELRKRHEEQWARVMSRTFRRQMDAVLGKVPKGQGISGTKTVVLLEELWDQARWNNELQADLLKLNNATATVWGNYIAEQLAFELDSDRMLGWLEEHSRIQAEYINGFTRDQIGRALIEEEPRDAVRHVFEVAIAARAIEIAVSAVTSASVFGSNEAAQQGGLKTKTWQVNSSNPRDEHLAMNGETVGIGELFSNGMRWPGDPAGGADNNANCQCSVTFGR